MSHLLLAVAVLALFFIAGMLVMRKHAARIEAAASAIEASTTKAAESVKTDVARVQATASNVSSTVAKAASDIKAAIKQ